MHAAHDYGYIMDHLHHVTSPYPVGQFNLSSLMWMDATEAAGTGRVLVTAETYPLLVNPMQISGGTGGVADFMLDAGLSNANRNYFLLASISGTSPGLPLPGGMVTLPLIWDPVTELIIRMANSPYLVNFNSLLDGSGQSTAQPDTNGPVPPSAVGITLYFAYLLYYPVIFYPYDYVSNPVTFGIVP